MVSTDVYLRYVNDALGVMDHWAGHVVAGRNIDRDRDADHPAALTQGGAYFHVHDVPARAHA
jgi:hypothetical protein